MPQLVIEDTIAEYETIKGGYHLFPDFQETDPNPVLVLYLPQEVDMKLEDFITRKSAVYPFGNGPLSMKIKYCSQTLG